MMLIDNKFEIGETIYLKTDKDQLPRVITAMQVSASDSLLYRTGCGTAEYWAAEVEMSKERVLNPETVGS